MRNNILRAVLLACVVLVAAIPAAAQSASQTATTQVSINMPSFVVLYYRSAVAFDVTESQLAGIVGHAGNAIDENVLNPLAANLVGFTDDALIGGSGYTAPGTLTGRIDNFWAVRTVAPVLEMTTVSVAFTPTGNTLSNGTDDITLSSLETRLSGAATFAGSSVTFAPTGLALADLQLGDVQFDVNLSLVSTSGAYTGGAIEITAENM